MKKKLKIALCLPWYAGPDPDCAAGFLAFQHYLGRVQERVNQGHLIPKGKLPPLDSWDEAGDQIPEWLSEYEISFVECAMIGYSLPGTARELAVERALASGADYMLWFDDDMLFNPAIFFQLLRHQLPFVGALAFTARLPITPVIYRFEPRTDGGPGVVSTPIMDYKRDALQRVDGVGFGMVLIQSSVFRRVPKPWFSSPGVGEDIQFCIRCQQTNVPIYVDTAAKTIHKPRYAPEWHSEQMYLLSRDERVVLAAKAFEEFKAEVWAEIEGKK